MATHQSAENHAQKQRKGNDGFISENRSVSSSGAISYGGMAGGGIWRQPLQRRPGDTAGESIMAASAAMALA
jgi:hypothetical protein